MSRVGDRYQFGDDINFHIWEIISDTKCIVIYSNDAVELGTVGKCRNEKWPPNLYKYLGNFSKDSNFNELYELFNQE